MVVNRSILILAFISLVACENRDVNHADGPNFNEIHEDMQYHFDKIEIEGNEYFILERDRNNPHEGFGFMALSGNKVSSNQDTIKAYLKTILDLQTEILAKQIGIQNEEAASYTKSILNYNLEQIQTPLETKEADD